MSSRDRERILTSIELALGFPSRQKKPKSREAPIEVPWKDRDAPWEPLQAEMEALTARFYVAEGTETTQEIIRAILEEHSVKRAVRWAHSLLDILELDRLLGEAGVEVFTPLSHREHFRQRCADADIGITAADAVLEESGSVLVKAHKGQERSTSLLPPVHLAIMTPGQRLDSVMDLPALLRQWRDDQGRLPSAVHMITGPSLTADIALQRILGVHGPKTLHVLAAIL